MKAHTVYGPPGTGKTTELMQRISTLRDEGYAISDLGLLSHTKAAAAEIKARLNWTGGKISTIHGLCFNAMGLQRDMVIGGEKLKAYADSIGVPMRGGDMDSQEQIERGDEYKAIMEKAVAEMRDSAAVYAEAQCSGTKEEFDYFVEGYRRWKKSKGLIDYNDMLARYVASPQPHDIKAVLVDEAQDLTPLQWAVLKAMHDVQPFEQMHVAGDDDQAIFTWGGADPHGMVAFEEEHNAERMVLGQSWRIPRVVHAIANTVIHRVPDRVPKQYRPREELGNAFDHGDLHSALRDADKHDTLVLCRTGSRKREIERHLLNNCTPHRTVGGFTGLWDNRTARALRVIHRMRADAGATLSTDDMRILAQEGDSRTKQLVADHNFTALIKRRDREIISIPPWMARFYDSVDLSVEPKIRLMTIHNAKGREADRVVLDTSLTQRVVDGMYKDPAAEARVFYVGVTRARHRLDLLQGTNGYDVHAPSISKIA